MVKVFVFLGYGFGATRWRARHARGEIPGLNEPLPYGYYRAGGEGWSIEYSEDAEEGRIGRLARRGLTRLLGFDLAHAWRNRRKLFESDIVWAHSEREHLAALVLRTLRVRRAPKIIAECIWLPDRWNSFSFPKRVLYRWLLARADAITSQSVDGVAWLRELVPGATIEWIPGGAKIDFMQPPTLRQAHRPVRLVALGGDMHRDWRTLLSAFGGEPDFELRIAPPGGKIDLPSGLANITVAAAKSAEDVRRLYAWADMAVVPLLPNLHVSGITVIFEAIVLGIPVLCTDTGGLRAYFPGDEVCCFSPRDPSSLREAARNLAADDERRLAMAEAAQRRVLSAALTTQNYADSHRRLSSQLLGLATYPCRPPSPGTRQQSVRVFVLLAHVFGAARWRERHARGAIPGLNDALPYGYYRAASDRWMVEYSEDRAENGITRFARRGLTHVIGFDLLHAWRHRRQLLAADVVWTHTEREGLAALALFRLLGRRSSPRIVAQCVWLFDRWHRFSAPRRALYRWLLGRADIVTTLSHENLESARQALPSRRSERLLFGWTSAEQMRPPRGESVHHPIRLASLGGDMHRDWSTLLTAFGGVAGFELRIASGQAGLCAGMTAENITVRPAQSESDVKALYDWADMAVVCLDENRHASGITVILEAVASGIPVVATDVGGLGDYFTEDEICYVPVSEPEALRDAVERLARDRERRIAMTKAAQKKLLEAGLTSEGYALRHRELSEELLGEKGAAGAPKGVPAWA
ncbi:MAG TPA: glycosyltransferase family 4 protein [Acetobacteraceae bacterium]|nr:glycosyltransferase family 4 protein [Acetobacteraceae bacterium]